LNIKQNSNIGSNALAGNYKKNGYGGKPASQIAEIANVLIDPILAKKAGINTMLIGVWDEIVGPEFEECSRPEKIIWPRQRGHLQSDPESGGGLEPGQLTIACEGSRALFLSHQQNEIISRINSFFGFPAINRIKIIQKAVQKHDKIRKKPRKLQKSEKQELSNMLGGVEDSNLKQALTKLGEAVLSKRQK
jgi:hypothetical protein